MPTITRKAQNTANTGGWRSRKSFSPLTSPFGGYKESGFGREGGRHGLEPYLDLDGTEAFGG